MRIRLAIALTLMAVGGGGAATAEAAVVSGANLTGAAPSTTFCGAPGSCTLSLAELPLASRAPGGVRAATDGVVASWRVMSGGMVESQSIRLRLVRNQTGVGTGEAVTLPTTAGIYGFATRLAVKANDQIALDLVGAKGAAGLRVVRSEAGAGMERWSPALADGAFRPADGLASGTELMINATIEPDADGDGYGDETQDRCPSSVATAGTCLPPAPIPTEAVPNTKISEVRVEGAKAAFRFSATVKGARFHCKLDKKRWKSCKSPRVYRGLEEGRHSFKVKAIGPTAVPDPSPATRSFRVTL